MNYSGQTEPRTSSRAKRVSVVRRWTRLEDIMTFTPIEVHEGRERERDRDAAENDHEDYTAIKDIHTPAASPI